MQGECWAEAEEEFLRALKKMKKDDIWVPTFGMHILPEYFPNRELGITYYQLGNFNNAIKYLTLSLNYYESDKAKYYLNLARKEKINLIHKDREAPSLHLDTYDPITSQPTQFISGEAKDNTFVANILITLNNNETISLMDVSEHLSYRFEKEVSLVPGVNHISIKTIDLFQNFSEKQIYIIVDQEGPIINFAISDTIYPLEKGFIKGFLYDPSEIAQFTINNNKINLIPTVIHKDQNSIISNAIYTFSYSPAPLDWEKGIFEYRAEDSQQNITEGTIMFLNSDLKEKRQRKQGSTTNPLKLAMVNQTTVTDLTTASIYQRVQQKNPSPVTITIDIHNLVTFEEEIYPQITIESFVKIKDITINEEPLLSIYGFKFGKLLPSIIKRFIKGKKSTLSFPVKVNLKEGDNSIHVEVIDHSGNKWSETKYIQKKQRQIYIGYNRWKMALPLIYYSSQINRQEGEKNEWCLQLLSVFNDENQKRFDFKELKGQGWPKLLPITSFENKPDRKILKILRRNNIDVYILCIIEDNIETTNVRVFIFDAETSERLGSEDEYSADNAYYVYEKIDLPGYEKTIDWHNKNSNRYFRIFSALLSKLKEDFPLCTGDLLELKGQRIKTTLSQKDRVKQGMKILLYEIDSRDIGKDFDILAEAKLEEVKKQFSLAKLKKKMEIINRNKGIDNLKVITK